MFPMVVSRKLYAVPGPLCSSVVAEHDARTAAEAEVPEPEDDGELDSSHCVFSGADQECYLDQDFMTSYIFGNDPGKFDGGGFVSIVPAAAACAQQPNRDTCEALQSEGQTQVLAAVEAGDFDLSAGDSPTLVSRSLFGHGAAQTPRAWADGHMLT